MRFQVPQFIEVEDKIFGPFTFKQFVYLAGGAGVAVACFSFLPSFIALLISAPVILLSLALTFVKINNKPFIYIVEAFFKYSTKEKLYIWKKVEKQAVPGKDRGMSNSGLYVPKLSDSKLKDLAWDITVKKTPNSVQSEDMSENLSE